MAIVSDSTQGGQRGVFIASDGTRTIKVPAVVVVDSAGTAVAAATQYTEDAAAAANPVGTVPMLVRRDTLSASEVSADGDNVALKGTSKGEAHVKDADVAALLTTQAGYLDGIATLITATNAALAPGGPSTSTARLLSAAASTNGANVKASAGTLKRIQGHNARLSAVYLKLYNKASTPTVGTDVPVRTVYLPASASFVFDFPEGIAFATGIGYGLTTAGADADTGALTAGDILCLNVDYI